MRINLPYNRPQPKEGEPQISDSELTADYINFAVMSTYKDGLDGQLRRVYGRLQRKLDAAIENGDDEVELEEAEKDLIKKSIKDCKFPANLAKYVVVLEDEIEKL